MTGDIEQLLKEGMDRATRGLRLPDGLARAAARRARQRRQAARAAAAAGTATVMAGTAAVVAGVTGAPGHPASQPRTVAYVVSRFERAATAASDGRHIQYARARYSAEVGSFPLADGWGVTTPTYPGYPWNIGSTVALTYGALSRLYANGPAGRPVYGESITATHGRPVITTAVIYWNRTWWRVRGASYVTSPRPAGPRPRHVRFGMITLGGMSPTIASLRSMVKIELARHELRVVGHQRVDGMDTIKVADDTGSNILWMNARNYLPVRFRYAPPHGHRGDLPFAVQTDYRLLTPTPARLALLRLNVPHGFKRITS